MSDLVINPAPMIALVVVLSLGLLVAILRTNELSRRVRALEKATRDLAGARELADMEKLVDPEPPAWLVKWFNFHFPAWFENWRADAIRRGKLEQ